MVAPGFSFQVCTCIALAGTTPVFIKSTGIAAAPAAYLIGLSGDPQSAAVFFQSDHDGTPVFGVFRTGTFQKQMRLAVYFSYINGGDAGESGGY